jgi:dUTP pyrophosphatase
MTLAVDIVHLDPDAETPEYATPGAAGFDFVAIKDTEVAPGQTVLVKTGIAMAIPQGYELQVRPRSGTSLKTTLRVANSPGTVDSDYRGEICIIITNTAIYGDVIVIKKGDRIAQGVICPVLQATFILCDELNKTKRGEGGFGSTGK